MMEVLEPARRNVRGWINNTDRGGMKRKYAVGIMKKTVLASLCLAAFSSFGCSGTQYGAARIKSTPAGAEIVNLRDNTNLGRTPATVVWQGDSSEQITIQLHKNGYQSTITSFWVNKRHSSEEEAKVNAIDVHSELEKE